MTLQSKAPSSMIRLPVQTWIRRADFFYARGERAERGECGRLLQLETPSGVRSRDATPLGNVSRLPSRRPGVPWDSVRRELCELLDRWLDRDDDRALFNLAPKTAVA